LLFATTTPALVWWLDGQGAQDTQIENSNITDTSEYVYQITVNQLNLNVVGTLGDGGGGGTTDLPDTIHFQANLENADERSIMQSEFTWNIGGATGTTIDFFLDVLYLVEYVEMNSAAGYQIGEEYFLYGRPEDQPVYWQNWTTPIVRIIDEVKTQEVQATTQDQTFWIQGRVAEHHVVDPVDDAKLTPQKVKLNFAITNFPFHLPESKLAITFNLQSSQPITLMPEQNQIVILNNGGGVNTSMIGVLEWGNFVITGDTFESDTFLVSSNVTYTPVIFSPLLSTEIPQPSYIIALSFADAPRSNVYVWDPRVGIKNPPT